MQRERWTDGRTKGGGEGYKKDSTDKVGTNQAENILGQLHRILFQALQVGDTFFELFHIGMFGKMCKLCLHYNKT